MPTTWDTRFFILAGVVAGWSKDPSTQVGAVVVDSEHRVRGVGYNGFPRGVKDDERLHTREQKYEITVHAEMNALFNSFGGVEGCHMYCTLTPCSRCVGAIVQAGITAVFSPKPTNERHIRDLHLELARDILREAGVDLFWIEEWSNDEPDVRGAGRDESAARQEVT